MKFGAQQKLWHSFILEKELSICLIFLLTQETTLKKCAYKMQTNIYETLMSVLFST